MKPRVRCFDLLFSHFSFQRTAIMLLFGFAVHASAATTSLRLNSQPGDYVGDGRAFFFTPSNGVFSGGYTFSNFVSISFTGPEHYFNLSFAAPQTQQLTVGTYEGSLRFPSQNAPQLDVWGDGRSCNTQPGRFQVKQVSYGNPLKFWATFEQHCEGSEAGLFGEIRFNADVPVVISAPGSTSISEGRTLLLTVSATELQNRRVALTASNLPPGASFVDNGNNTGTFAWTPDVGRAGAYEVGFRADNGLGATDSTTTRILVTVAADDFADAFQILQLPYTNNTYAAAATAASDDPFTCTFPRNTIWYAFTPPTSMRIQATTAGSDYNTVLSAFTGFRNNLTLVHCDDNVNAQQAELVFDVQAGRTYYFMAGASGSGLPGNLVFSVKTLTPPSNDEITTATSITALPYVNLLDTTGAIGAQDDPSACGSLQHTVWYSFTSPVPLRIEARTVGSDYKADIGVFIGTRGALNLIACGDSPDGTYSQIAFNAAANRPYLFMVSGPGSQLKFSLSAVVSPVNDDIDHSTVITALPFNDAINTSMASTNRDDPASCSQPGASVWYSFTPSQDLFVDANAEASDYSVVLSAWTGSRTALEQVACFGSGYVRFSAVGGTTYFIMAAARFGNEGGHLLLTLTGRPKLKIGVTVDADGGADSKTGAATIQGTVTCSRPVIVRLNGFLRQTGGRFHVIAGDFGAPFPFPGGPPVLSLHCDGVTPWSARIFSDDGSFGGGHAFVSASADAFIEEDLATAQTEATIHLSGSKRVRLDPDQAQLLSVAESPNGTVLVQSISVMGQTNVLQASTNLRDWVSLATNVPLSNPSDWATMDSRTYPQRFYRVLTLP